MVEDLYGAVELSRMTGVPEPVSVFYERWSPSTLPMPRGVPVAVDLETVRNTTKIVQVNWSAAERTGYAAPWTEEVARETAEGIRGASPLILHNGQFDLWQFWENGLTTRAPLFDTMIGAAILDPDLPNGLEHVSKDFCDVHPWKHTSKDDLWRYGCVDADVTFRVFLGMREQLRSAGVEGVFGTSMQVLPLLIEMRRAGLRVDQVRRAEMAEACLRDETEAQARLDGLAAGLPKRDERARELALFISEQEKAASLFRSEGSKAAARAAELAARRAARELEEVQHVNWNSPQQLLGVLDAMGMPRKVSHKTGRPTTDAATIQELARQSGNKVLLELLRLRERQKLRTTFLNRSDERIHPEYLLHRDYELEGAIEGACSGRLASKNPNIQNWPDEVRRIIVPDYDDWEMLEADYSQIEFRVIAYRSGGEIWRALNTEGFDVHRAVASEVYGVRPEDVTEDQRDQGKRAVYSGAYGVGPITFSRRLMADGIHMPVAQCRRLLDAFKKLFPEVVRAQKMFVEEAYRTNKVTNPFGRYRRFYAPNAETTAIYNYFPQSTAGDIILRAMSKLRTNLPQPARIAVQVHDSLLLTYPREMRETVVDCVRDCMVFDIPEMPGFRVPIGIKIGRNWGKAKPGNEEGLRKI